MDWVDKEQTLVQLLRKLIDISSPTGREGEVGEYLEEVLTGLGLQVSRQNVSQDRFNLLATTDTSARVLLCTHMDTVLPHIPSSLIGGIIRGRGACDAKGAMAAMISAVEKIIRKGRSEVGLLFVVGEERDSDGARKAAELELNSHYVILGEPTENRVATGQKGTILFQVKVSGRAAHSACPEKGRSAIKTLVDLIGNWTTADWGVDPVLGHNTLNIGRIGGGVGANVIAAEADAEGIFRIGTSSAMVKERLLAYGRDDVFIEILSSSEPMRLCVPIGVDTTVVSFGSDAPYLQALGEVVMVGPGSIEHAHGQEELVSVDQLISARNQYVDLVEKLGSLNG